MTPQHSTTLYGHTDILQRLLQAYAQQHLHHSLLFVGPEGVGKETLAYHLMRTILKDDTRLASGNHPHLFVIQPVFDEKKQRFKRDITLDALEGLSNFLRLSPVDDKPRFILVNPADGMNPQTQNALLKVLEEPPANVFFILLATQTAAMLPTIRSRCLIVPVPPLNEKDFTRGLLHLVPEITMDTAETYFAMAEGVIGRAVQLEREGLLGHYERFCQAINEWVEEKNSVPAMQFAEAMAASDMQETTDALVALFQQRLAHFIRSRAQEQSLPFIADMEETVFLRWMRVSPQKLLQDWERLETLWREGVNAYLDRKVVLLSFLRVVAGMDTVKEPVV